MTFEPEISLIRGEISHIAGEYIWISPGTRIVLNPGHHGRELAIGMRVTVRAVRRHGQLVAEQITPEPSPGG
jgi:hypothetical protein